MAQKFYLYLYTPTAAQKEYFHINVNFLHPKQCKSAFIFHVFVDITFFENRKSAQFWIWISFVFPLHLEFRFLKFEFGSQWIMPSISHFSPSFTFSFLCSSSLPEVKTVGETWGHRQQAHGGASHAPTGQDMFVFSFVSLLSKMHFYFVKLMLVFGSVENLISSVKNCIPSILPPPTWKQNKK